MGSECPICNKTGEDIHETNSFGLPWWRCTACGLDYSASPTADELARLYTSEDFISTDKPSIARRIARTIRARSQYGTITTHGPRHGSMLDVGCGGGALMGVFRKKGWKSAGIDYKNADFRSLDEAAAATTWDVIAFSHSLEHMTEPVDMLRLCGVMLTPGGVVFVEVPCMTDELAHDQPVRTRPGHLLGFREKTLPLMAEAAGLRVTSIRTLWWPGTGPIIRCIAMKNES